MSAKKWKNDEGEGRAREGRLVAKKGNGKEKRRRVSRDERQGGGPPAPRPVSTGV